MPAPQPGLLQEKTNTDMDPDGGRRSLKRNKTFTATPAPGQQKENVARRHRRGTKGRYTVPLISAPSSPMINPKLHDPFKPLYIRTDQGIFEEVKPLLDRQQPLLETCKSKDEQHSPKSSTSSSGFGSSHSAEVSPKCTAEKNITIQPFNKANFHFWLLLCIQFVTYYFRKFTRKSETTPNQKKPAPEPELRPSKRANLKRQDLGRVKRKLQFQDELEGPKWKPFYAELHLGRKNQHDTTMAALEADRLEYPAKKLITTASETKYITTVFEIRLRGLEELANDVRHEIQGWYGENDDNVLIVCCEMQWSSPDQFRNILCETRMKDDVMKCLRANNRRVCQTVARRNEKRKSDQYIILPDSITEEKAGRRPDMKGCFGGSYRRYYAGLIPCGHRETAEEHQPWWEFQQHSMPDSIKWPLIASPQKTTVVLLNLISFKLDQL